MALLLRRNERFSFMNYTPELHSISPYGRDLLIKE